MQSAHELLPATLARRNRPTLSGMPCDGDMEAPAARVALVGTQGFPEPHRRHELF